MTTKDLNQLLNESITVDEFKLSINGEVENYRLQMSKKGAQIDLKFLENEQIHLNKQKFGRLLNFVLDRQLSNIHLVYICDCLTLAEELITDEKTRNLIFELADPEINGGYIDEKLLAKLVSKID